MDAVDENRFAAADQFAFAFHQDFDAAADHLAIQLPGDFLLNGEKFVVSPALDFLGNVVGETIDGHRSGPGRVFEDEAVLESGFADQIDGGGEIVVGFGGEADDEIAGDADIGHVLAGAGEEIAVLSGGVAAVHEFQNAIAAVLGGGVEIAADAGAIAHGGKGVVAEIARETGDEAQSRQIGNGFVNVVQQARQRS